MDRNRIGIESIQDDEAVMILRRVLQLETCVTQNDLCRSSGAILQVRKIVCGLRDADHRWIDFVKSPGLIRTRVRNHRSCSQSHNGNIRRRNIGIKRREDLSEWSIAMKVRKRLTLEIRIGKLTAVYGVAMIKRAGRALRIEPHTQSAEEISLHMQGPVLDLGVDDAANHDGADSEGEPDRTTPKTMVDDHQRNSENDRYTRDCADLILVHKERQSDSE